MNSVYVRFVIRALVAGLTAFLAVLPVDAVEADKSVVIAGIVAAAYAILGLIGPQEPSVGVEYDLDGSDAAAKHRGL